MNSIRKLLTLFLMLCACTQTWADEWTDSNGIKWSFTVNGTEATDIVMVPTPPLERHYIYGGSDNPDQQPFQVSSWDANTMRFSDAEGAHFPTISDDVYFSLKTLILDVADVEPYTTMRAMNAWWSETYFDDVLVVAGPNEVQITQEMANACAQGGEGKDLTLMLKSGSCTVNSVYYETASEIPATVVIPAKVYAGSTELTVTSIGPAAFAGCNGLTSVTIPSSVTSIGFSAFYGCTGLTSVTIPSGVTTIGGYAFSGCTGLTGVTIPSSVTSIEKAAFKGCTGLTSVTIPSSVTTIEYAVFSGCTGLTSITIPSGVTTIGSGAFLDCTGLTSVTIPSSVTIIVNNAFSHCTSLTSIKVESGNPVYDSRDNCNAIIKTETNTLLIGCKSTVIPNTVTVIGSGAFYNCTSLTSVTIPSSVTTIADGAFSCTGLTSVTIPSSVTNIVIHAFYHCTSLTSIKVESGNPVYDSRDNCNAIIETETNTLILGCKNTMIPNTVTTIGSDSFLGCIGLTSVTIPSSVTTIGDQAFYGCPELTTIYSYMQTPVNIFSSTFLHYNATLYVPEGSLEAYQSHDVWGQFATIEELASQVTVGGINYQLNYTEFTAKVTGATSTTLTSVSIPETITSEGGTFTVTSVGNGAFANYSKLKLVSLPSTLTSLEEGAFYRCNLTGVVCNATTPPTTPLNPRMAVFSNLSNTILYVPNGCLETYNSAIAGVWRTFGKILEQTVTIDGVIYQLVPGKLEAQAIGKGVSGRSIEILGSFTYQDLSFTVTSIAKKAFQKMTGLLGVTIDEGVKTIGSHAFQGCTGLKSLTIPSTVTTIGTYALSGLSHLNNLYCYATTPPSVSSNTFNAATYKATLHVPEGSVETYQSHEVWGLFGSRILPIIGGDVNGDQNVDVADFMAVANYILNNPVEHFNPNVADVAGSATGGPDGIIDVADFMGIANIILNKDAHSIAPKKASKAPRKAATDIDALDNAIYVEPVTAAPGTQQVLSVRMKNTAQVSAFEFNLQLPEGITFASDAVGVLAELSTERTTARKTSYFGASVQDDGTLKVLCGTTTEDPSTGKPYAFEGNEGEVALITIEVPEDYEEGVYEVSVIDGKISNPEGDKTDLDSPITTELTIGDTTVVLDENSTDDIPATAAAVPVKVLRTFKQDTWSTVCFPFAMTEDQLYEVFGDDVEIKDFVNYVAEYIGESDDVESIRVHFEDFDPADGLEANYPVLLKTQKADFDEFTLTVQLEPNEANAAVEYDNGKTGSRRVVFGTLQGVYKITAVPENCLFISGNKFWYSTGATMMKAFRAYFWFEDVIADVANAGANIQMVFDKTTGISEKVTVNSEESDAWYTLDGMRLEKKPTKKGVYIFNGKKIVVK